MHAQGIVQKFNPESNQVKVSRKHNQCPWNWVATVGEQLRHLATILYFYTQCINAGYAFPHLGWFGGLHVGYQPQLTFSEWWTKHIYLLGNPSWLVPKGFNQMPTPSISQVTHWWVFHHSPSVYESDDQRSKTPGLICKGKSSEPLNQCQSNEPIPVKLLKWQLEGRKTLLNISAVEQFNNFVSRILCCSCAMFLDVNSLLNVNSQDFIISTTWTEHATFW